jgi:hypothetical protein
MNAEPTTPLPARPAVVLKRLVRRRHVIYHVWTDEDGPMKRHRFAGGSTTPDIQGTAQWWSEVLQCYVQLHDKKGRIVASAGKMFDAPNAKVSSGDEPR